MKNKQIFIVSAIALVVAFGGVLMSLYLRDPEILTKTPAEIILGDINGGKNNGFTEITSEPIIAGDCLVVSSSYCDSATFVHSTVQGGAIIPRLIGFNVPTGTKIFAPRSGYIHVMHRRPDEIHPEKITISILDTPDRTVIPPMGRRITLITLEFDFVIQELMGARAPFVERGTLLGTVANNSSMYPTLIEEEVNLMLEIGSEWELDASINNPIQYIQKIIGGIN